MKLALPLLFLLFCTYLLAFPFQLRPEQEFRPAWVMDILTEPVQPPTDVAPAVPFELGLDFGYVDTGGNLLYRDTKLFGVAADANRFINYSSVSGNLVLQNVSGEVVDSFEVRGYPLLAGERLLLISSNRAELAELNEAGEEIWKREYAAIITDLEVSGDLIAVGLLDSRVELISADGSVFLRKELMGSRINTVYGVALSQDGATLAVVHGIQPQNVSLFDLRSGGTQVFRLELDSEYRSTRYTEFVADDSYLVVESPSGALIIDVEKAGQRRIETSGSLFSVGVLEDLLWLASKSQNGSELTIVQLPGKTLSRFPFAAGDAMAASVGDRVIIGINRYICMVEKIVR